jgi:hypothetical protein
MRTKGGGTEGAIGVWSGERKDGRGRIERNGFWGGEERGDLCGRVENGMQGKSEEREMEKGGVDSGEEWREGIGGEEF